MLEPALPSLMAPLPASELEELLTGHQRRWFDNRVSLECEINLM